MIKRYKCVFFRESERKLDMLKVCARDRLMALRKVAVRDDNRGPVLKWTAVDYVISGLLLCKSGLKRFYSYNYKIVTKIYKQNLFYII